MVKIIGSIFLIVGLLMVFSGPLLSYGMFLKERGELPATFTGFVKWFGELDRIGYGIKEMGGFYWGITLVGLAVIWLSTLPWEWRFRRILFTILGSTLFLSSLVAFVLKLIGVLSTESDETRLIINHALLLGAVSGVLIGLFAYTVRIYCKDCGYPIGFRFGPCPECERRRKREKLQNTSETVGMVAGSVLRRLFKE